ncbi:MAG: hypothetical protein JNK95_06010 [Candidatus Competibacter sp.]|nr:hypothetical protein [Candidatus Competibacter sp.]MDG4606536.1 hypothetical protein [Candidatus Contendobacter sp.]HRD50605.1 hypothetical protein [Candidatus Contendobacter sp.]
MTEHDKHPSGVGTAAHAQPPSQGRRRLVKGAIIAVPAIFTVRNGFARPNSMPPSQDEACSSFLAGGINAPGYQSFIGIPGNANFDPTVCIPPPPATPTTPPTSPTP